MTNLTTIKPTQTMSSREIAELSGIQHKRILEDVRNMLNSLGIDPAEFSANYRDYKGRNQPIFNLPKRECLILVSGYNIQLRTKIIDHWQELEQVTQVIADQLQVNKETQNMNNLTALSDTALQSSTNNSEVTVNTYTGEAYISQRKAAELLGVARPSLQSYIERNLHPVNSELEQGLTSEIFDLCIQYYALDARNPTEQAKTLLKQITQVIADQLQVNKETQNMNNLTALSDITHSTVTHMTLKEVTDLLDVRHNDAMNTVEIMAENEEFGMITKISYSYKMPNGGTKEGLTYQLSKRQSIAVAAKLNTSLLMRIIDRWQELEQVTQAIADTLQVDKEGMIKELKQDNTIAKLQAGIQASKDKAMASQLKLQALKDKLAKQSEVLHAKTTAILARGAKVKGDMVIGKLDLPTDTITNLLKEHGSTIEPKLANWALRQLGYLAKTHEVTDTGHYYGRNIKSSPRSKTTLARWFPSEFPELLKQIESTIEDLVNN